MVDPKQRLTDTAEAVRAAEQHQQAAFRNLCARTKTVYQEVVTELGRLGFESPGGSSAKDVRVFRWGGVMMDAACLDLGVRRVDPARWTEHSGRIVLLGANAGEFATLTVTAEHLVAASPWLDAPQTGDSVPDLLGALMGAHCRRVLAQVAPPEPEQADGPPMLPIAAQRATAGRAAWLLQELRRLDPVAADWLVSIRYQVTEEVAQHPELAITPDPTGSAPGVLCVVGILNALLGLDSPVLLALNDQNQVSAEPR